MSLWDITADISITCAAEALPAEPLAGDAPGSLAAGCPATGDRLPVAPETGARDQADRRVTIADADRRQE